MKQEIFDIIELRPEAKHYYGDSLKMPDILLKDGTLVKAGTIEIPLGHSRYGGPIADLPKDFEYPNDLRFAGQLDLKQIALHDKSELLPKSGHLFFFADIMEDKGLVVYADLDNNELVRVVKDHEDNFFEGVLIKEAIPSIEKLSDRYREPEYEDEEEYTNEDGLLWDYFAGSETSKIFGIFTHCQYQEKQILEVVNSDKVVLLQIGENGFNDEGVFSVLIDKNDLKALNFDNCIFHWGQS
ncbi:DUF1963 domain-containing protein [Flavobacterium reichenbachii]|uniref:DUF1963 domain-containing protein n=1 Tax=Flavobacterium reichenbachii TaxID=362418 RepID=A0A085ZGA6_9FLAO|nr:DUF1963 domain-containing protein [Flavobacterium reichenbachii]KFF03470.1 hypothetical protein IW19_21555 [Flavobacterium reichenbachii]OXB15708.1 hypothetical protein B0A68_09975 [Flavobacterium reichenbachii]